MNVFAEFAEIKSHERGRLPGHDVRGEEGEGVEQVGQLWQDGVGNLDVEGLLYEAAPGVPEGPCSQLKSRIDGPCSQLMAQLMGHAAAWWLHGCTNYR